jgi:putative ABC transport system permease protein
VLVRGDGSASDLGADLEAALGGASGVGVSDREVLLREFDEQTRTATFAIYVMVLMIAGYAAITVANTLASSTATRRRELGLQRLAGATRGQVVRMVATEGAMVAVGGIALGTLAAGAVLVPVGLKRLDSPLPAGSPLLYAAVVVGTALLALAATLAPAWRVTRGRPAEAALAVE